MALPTPAEINLLLPDALSDPAALAAADDRYTEQLRMAEAELRNGKRYWTEAQEASDQAKALEAAGQRREGRKRAKVAADYRNLAEDCDDRQAVAARKARAVYEAARDAAQQRKQAARTRLDEYSTDREVAVIVEQLERDMVAKRSKEAINAMAGTNAMAATTVREQPEADGPEPPHEPPPSTPARAPVPARPELPPVPPALLARFAENAPHQKQRDIDAQRERLRALLAEEARVRRAEEAEQQDRKRRREEARQRDRDRDGPDNGGPDRGMDR